MANTGEILGRIAAMQTLVEKFPDSILDMFNIRTTEYSSVFDFMVDVLESCGMPLKSLIETLIMRVYGFDDYVQNYSNEQGNGLVTRIKNGNYDKLNQSKFVKTMEEGIKDVLMGLFTSIYTCSAVPIFPDKVFDSSSLSDASGNTLMNTNLKTKIDNRYYDKKLNYPLHIPVKVIDMMGMLNINPTSEEGRFYYNVDGKDIYYHKEEVEYTSAITKTVYHDQLVEEVENVKKYRRAIPISLIKEEGDNDVWFFSVPSSGTVSVPLYLTVKYIPAGEKEAIVGKVSIAEGTQTSQGWNVTAKKGDAYTKILSFSINDKGLFAEVGNSSEPTQNDCVYFDASLVGDEDWVKYGWTQARIAGGLETITGDTTITNVRLVTSAETFTSAVTLTEIRYVECDYDSLPENENFERENYVPSPDTITDKSPEYIVVYDGLSPNMLYRSNDLNAFLWYVINKGQKIPAIEYNHMMWDSRVSAEKEDLRRETDEEWNMWYDSKRCSPGVAFPDGEFTIDGNDNDILYPILQIESNTKSLLTLHIPSQRYFQPKKRKRIKNGGTPKESLNASIYRFDWEYLQNIEILNPRLLLIKMCEYLLGFTLDTVASITPSFTKKTIQAKLSTAIKNIIEADDMQVEDCYMTFSNDEFNQMMEEMLMEKYKATYYGGESSVVRAHNVNEYISMLDKVNSSSSAEGTVEVITKLVNDITVDPGEEGKIDYGFDVNFDGNILKKLLWGLTEPIMESLFTPKVLLLVYINFYLTGITKIDNFMGEDLTKLISLSLNKILGLMKGIIIMIKDKIVEELLKIWEEQIYPLLVKWWGLLIKERLEAYRRLLEEAAEALKRCGPFLNVPVFKKNRKKNIAEIDDVNYADIITEDSQEIPETDTSC